MSVCLVVRVCKGNDGYLRCKDVDRVILNGFRVKEWLGVDIMGTW